MLTVHGCYARRFKDSEGIRYEGWVAQARCEACNRYPSLIPDFLMPYKHYKAEVIEDVIREAEEEGNDTWYPDAQNTGVRRRTSKNPEVNRGTQKRSNCAADVSTMRRWIRQFRERGEQAVGWMLSALAAVYERYISAVELQNKKLLERLARLAGEVTSVRAGEVIGKVNYIITRHNYGFL
jgi:hypothetical protein